MRGFVTLLFVLAPCLLPMPEMDGGVVPDASCPPGYQRSGAFCVTDCAPPECS